MADSPSFTKLVPGFEFLQSLVKNAGAALPGIGQWVAPTLDPAELEKRIEELRTVQFWLEQNARMLGATIQALEVQRMTLSTLKTMNVQMDDLRESMKIKMPDVKPFASAPAPASPSAAEPEAVDAGEAKTTSVVDPMQWWGALTKQFTELAASAIKDTTSKEAPQNIATTMLKQSFDAANQTLKDAVAMQGKTLAPFGDAAVAVGKTSATTRARAVAKTPARKSARKTARKSTARGAK